MISPIHREDFSREDDSQEDFSREDSPSDRPLRLGLDIGSTTVKVVVVDDGGREILWARYTRHYSDVLKTVYELASEALDHYPRRHFTVAVTGSAGIGVSQKLELPLCRRSWPTQRRSKPFSRRPMWPLNWAAKMRKSRFSGTALISG